ncbi:MAG: S8 family serine peptidase [Chitinivibrionales bacterium]|nr:S8 family serine peptidase [Chitinivibrionales bacterium]
MRNSIESMSLSYSRQMPSVRDCDFDEFVVMDDFAYRWPYPVFCNPTANNGYQYQANWQCYNAISVGNVRDSNLTHYMCDDRFTPVNFQQSQTTNPDAVYGDTDDREMPNVVVPGIHPDGDTIYTEPWDHFALGQFPANGTSLSAPICNGIAACVMSANSSYYRTYPERVRAAIMVTAQNVHGGEWDASVDGRDGAGVVSGYSAATFAQQATVLWGPTMYAYEQACAWDDWAEDDYSNKVYAVKTPSQLPANKHLRLVLTWDSNPDMVNMDNSLSDFDLVFSSSTDIQDYIAYSSSYNGNVEIVDIPRNDLEADETYYAILTAFTFRVPDGARSSSTYYSLAWTWVADHAD